MYVPTYGYILHFFACIFALLIKSIVTESDPSNTVLIFWGTPRYFPEYIYHSVTPPTVHRGPDSHTSLPILDAAIFDKNYLKVWEAGVVKFSLLGYSHHHRLLSSLLKWQIHLDTYSVLEFKSEPNQDHHPLGNKDCSSYFRPEGHYLSKVLMDLLDYRGLLKRQRVPTGVLSWNCWHHIRHST